MNSNFKRYIIFWLSQALSQLGSSKDNLCIDSVDIYAKRNCNDSFAYDIFLTIFLTLS